MSLWLWYPNPVCPHGYIIQTQCVLLYILSKPMFPHRFCIQIQDDLLVILFKPNTSSWLLYPNPKCLIGHSVQTQNVLTVIVAKPSGTLWLSYPSPLCLPDYILVLSGPTMSPYPQGGGRGGRGHSVLLSRTHGWHTVAPAVQFLGASRPYGTEVWSAWSTSLLKRILWVAIEVDPVHFHSDVGHEPFI